MGRCARIGEDRDSMVECSEAHGEWGRGPVAIHVYVADVDAGSGGDCGGRDFAAEPKDQFCGERNGTAIDAWEITVHCYASGNVSEAEVRRRARSKPKRRVSFHSSFPLGFKSKANTGEQAMSEF